jgi:hypothetical protein
VDISFDARSSTLDLVSYWSKSSENDGWTETIHKSASGKTEVGILALQRPLEPEEVRVGGFLAVIGEDDALSMPTEL